MPKSTKRVWLALPTLLLTSLMLLGFVVPTVGAQTQTTTQDDPTALIKALESQRYYVANSVANDATFKKANPNIDSALRDAVNKQKKQDVFIAIITNSSYPSNLGVKSDGAYINNILSFLNKPAPQALILINLQSKKITISAPKLNETELNTIINDATSDIAGKGTTVGAVNAVNNTGDKLSSNESGSFITTLVIILVVILVIVGAVSFLLINTRRSWKQKVDRVESLASHVSDQVVKVSDDINFLPDATRDRTNADFGVATQNFSEANTRLRELQTASPIALLLKGPDYQRKLDLTGAQFEQVRQALGRVAQETQRALPPS